MLGRAPLAEAGQLNIVAAGAPELIEEIRPILDPLGRRTWVVGRKARQANLVKIGVNYNLIHALQALAESITLIESGGVDGPAFVEILTDVAFAGSAYTGYGNLIATSTYCPPGFTVGLGRKDLSLAAEAAASHGVVLPDPACPARRVRPGARGPRPRRAGLVGRRRGHAPARAAHRRRPPWHRPAYGLSEKIRNPL